MASNSLLVREAHALTSGESRPAFCPIEVYSVTRKLRL